MYNGYGTKKTIYNNANVKAVQNSLTAHGVYEYKSKRSNPAEQEKRVIERWLFVTGHEYAFSEKMKLITKFYSYGTKRNWARQEL